MRFRLFSVTALLATAPGVSLALGLGDETVRSFLNAPLNAEIELLATPEELGSLRVQLASRDDFIRHGLEYPGFLSAIQLGTERLRDGRNIIRLSSTQPMVEPFVVVLVDVRTDSSRLLREYTLLLDPPTFQASPAPAAPVAAPITGPTPGTTVRPAPAPAQSPPPPPPPVQAPVRPAAPVAQPAPQPVPQPAAPAPAAAPSGGGGQYSVQRGDTLSNISSRTYGAADRTRGMVAIFRANPEAFAGNINQLRAGATLDLPAQDAVAALDRREAAAEVRGQMSSWLASVQPSTESAEARLRLVPPTAPAGTGDTAGTEGGRPGTTTPAAPTGDRPIAVDSPDLANLQRGQAPATPATPPAESTPAPEPSEEVDVADLGVTEPVPAEPAPTAETPAAPAQQPSAPAAEPSGPGLLDRLKEYWIYAAAGAGLLVLALLLVAARRRRNASAAYAPITPSLDDFEIPPDRDASADTFPLRRPTDARDSTIVVEEEAGLREPGRRDTRTVDLDEGGVGGAMGTLAMEQGDPLAEADFHMAYGLYDQAADLVKAALQREPDRRDLKLKLLEVFFVWGNKDQFLQTARDLSKTRGTAPPGEWEKVVIMGKQLAPEDVLFHQSQMGAQTSVDLNLEGGQNLVDFNLPDIADDGSGDGVDMDLGSTDTGLKPLDSEGGLDFMFGDGPVEDQAPTATTRQMQQPGLDTINAPTVEQPMPEIGDTLAGKLDAHVPYSGSPDQTAELALDDLGLDLGKLEATGTGLLPINMDPDGEAPTMVAGLDETSRELLSRADASQRTEMLPLADFDLSGTSPGLDMDLGGGDTGTAPALDAGAGADLDLDVGAADQPDGDWQNTQRIDPGMFDEAPRELEPVTMSEVGTKLDLARAYMDMGDPDGARSILNEVLQEGSDSQRQEAQRLLDSIPG
jgi:pilus assembly protein FimV